MVATTAVALSSAAATAWVVFAVETGFATPDDVEALESCQQGFTSGGVEWSDISRGMAREQHGNDEGQMRVFWRRWAEQMGSPSVK